MNTMQVDILNPKAAHLLKMQADMKLISIREEKEDDFLKIINRIRSKAKAAPPTIEEITNEVEMVRSKRYEGRKG